MKSQGVTGLDLAAYLKLLTEIDELLPKDESALPKSKAVLESALLSEMRMATAERLPSLVKGFLRLSQFQKVSWSTSRALIKCYTALGLLVARSGTYGNREKDAVCALAIDDQLLSRLVDLVMSDRRRLQLTLTRSGIVPESVWENEVASIAAGAEAFGARIGASTKVSASDVYSLVGAR